MFTCVWWSSVEFGTAVSPELDQAGLGRTEKVGRVRTCKLGQRGLPESFGQLDELLTTLV
jgi:hypothetical protein